MKFDKNTLTSYQRAYVEKYIKMRKSAKENGYRNNIDWVNYIIFFPQDAKKCEKVGGFKSFTTIDWISILKFQPCLKKYFDKLYGFEKFSTKDWCWSICSIEDDWIIKEANKLDIWKSFSEDDWVFLLKHIFFNRPSKSKVNEILYNQNIHKKISLLRWAKEIYSEDKDLNKFYYHILKITGYGQFKNKDWGNAAKKASYIELEELKRLKTELESDWEAELL